MDEFRYRYIYTLHNDDDLESWLRTRRLQLAEAGALSTV